MADNVLIIEVEFEGKKGFATLNKDALKAGEDTAKEFGKSFASNLTSSFIQFKAAIGLIKGIANSFKESIDEAAKEDQAINQLNQALANNGRFSEAAAASFANFAEEMAKTTSFADEQVIAMSRLATNFTRTNEEAQKLVQASIELSAATGVDADSAIQRLGRSLTGAGDGLKKLIPGFKGMSEEALASGKALDFVLERFGGTAASQINTFSGALNQATKSFNEVIEASGKSIIQSPAVIEFLKGVSKIFDRIAFLTKEAFTAKEIKEFVLQLITLGQIIVDFVIRPLERTMEIGQFVFNALAMLVNSAIQSFSAFGLNVSQILNKLGIVNDETVQSMQDKYDVFSKTTQELADKTAIALGNIGRGTWADELGKHLESVQVNVQKTGDAFVNGLAPKSNATANSVVADMTNMVSAGEFFSVEFVKKWDEASQQFIQIAEGLKFELDKLLVKSIVGSVQAITKAVMAGKNAFKAFSDALLGIFGNVLVQLGTALIMAGIGIDALKASLVAFSGAAAIAAGIALVALGTVLQGLGGGAAIEGNTNFGGISSATNEAIGGEPGEREKPKTEVVVNIAGNVLDRRETGLEIVSIMQEHFDTNSGVLSRA